jgi:hypothetical protein
MRIVILCGAKDQLSPKHCNFWKEYQDGFLIECDLFIGFRFHANLIR